MNILLITPAGRRSLAGNRATATRWAGFLRKAGHRVRIATDFDGQPADALIALHAWRSAEAIEQFRRLCPETPRVVVLTGTDIYRFQHSHPEPTLASMEVADVLVGLHECVGDDIPAHFRQRLRVVLQSAQPLPSGNAQSPVRRHFDICVVGHLREEKDSLRAAKAVRELPQDSRLRVVQVGRAHDVAWETAAQAETQQNRRFVWRGEVPHWRVRRLMGQVRAMVMSSRMEGGANAVAEACAAGLPVIASDISGNVGMLGKDYAGYYPVGDTVGLREMLLQAERSPAFLGELKAHCTARAELFTPEREARGVLAALEQACRCADARRRGAAESWSTVRLDRAY